MNGLTWSGNYLIQRHEDQHEVLGVLEHHHDHGDYSFSLKAPKGLFGEYNYEGFFYSELIPVDEARTLHDAQEYVLRSKATEVMFVLWIMSHGHEPPKIPSLPSIEETFEAAIQSLTEKLQQSIDRHIRQKKWLFIAGIVLGAIIEFLFSLFLSGAP